MVIIESLILCIIFTIVVIPPLYKNPLNCIMSYPPTIRKRVESLPQYNGIIKKYQKKHIAMKLIFLVICVGVLTVLAWSSGARTFVQGFAHTFTLFFIVNMYDLFILDLWLFCHNEKVIIKGTEDMINEYKSPMHHIRGAFIGLAIGCFVGFATGGVIEALTVIIL